MSIVTNPEQGRKTFFVKPNSVIQEQMVSELLRQEFEVYLVPEVEQARRLFTLHPDCVAFLNIDEGLTEPGWEDVIREVRADPDLKELKLGILTYHADPLLAKKYLFDFEVVGGFVKLSLSVSESTQTVLRVLEANQARGRRKYVRVRCPGHAEAELPSNGGVLHAQIVDLSSVGMACRLEHEVGWASRTVLPGMQLHLKGLRAAVNGIVIGKRLDEQGEVTVILFDPKTPELQRARVRSYIAWALQEQLAAELG